MRIERLEAVGFAGLKNVLFDPECVASIICSANNQGKSSFVDAIGFLLTGLARGIDKKKDAGILATGKPCKVSGCIGGMEIARTPAGCSVAEAILQKRFGSPEMVRALLDAFRFVEMSARERRDLVQVLTADPKALAAKTTDIAKAAGLGSAEQEVLAGLITGPKGLDAAEKMAVEERRAAKRAQEESAGEGVAPSAVVTVDGEEYDLSETSAQAIEGQLAEREVERKKIMAERDKLLAGYGTAKLGDSEAEVKARIEAIDRELFTIGKVSTAERLDVLRKTIYSMEGLATKARESLAAAAALLNGARARYKAAEALKGACPTCGRDITADALAAYLETISSEGKRQADKAEALKGEVAKIEKDLAGQKAELETQGALAGRFNELNIALDGEKAALAAVQKFAEVEAAVDKVTARLDEVDRAMNTGRRLLEARRNIDRATEAANEAGAQAEAAGRRVEAWDVTAKALGKDGPIRKAAADGFSAGEVLAHAATLLPGREVTIDGDWNITVDSCPAIRISRSERWRLGAAFAAALARRSGLGFLVLDEADLLDDDNRSTFMGWLESLATAPEGKETPDLDSIVVLATAPRPPEPPEGNWLDCWQLQDGHLLRLVPTKATRAE